jgi:hypothetical protein
MSLTLAEKMQEPESYGGLTLDELKAKHGDLTMMNTPRGPLIFKRPSDPVYADFVDSMSRDKASKHASMKRLALACCVFPSLPEARDILETYPGVVLKAQGIISELGGAADEGAGFDIKKL